jgi:hypothetical protein
MSGAGTDTPVKALKQKYKEKKAITTSPRGEKKGQDYL